MTLTQEQLSVLVSEVLGEVPTALERMTFGHNSVTFEVVLRDRTLILRTNADANVFRKTEHNLSVLRGLGLPVPNVLMRDLSLVHYPVAYLLLEKIPGRDLRYELASMTLEQQTQLARQIVGYQKKVATLPEGRGFGYVPIGEEAPFVSWLELLLSETRRFLSPDPTPEQAHWQARVFALVERYRVYLEKVKPTCFLDDLTTKNVIVAAGELQGLIDFDVVCYGDPLLALGLTATAVVTNVGLAQLSYVGALSQAYELDSEKELIVWLYASLCALTFLENADTEEKRRLIQALTMWTAELTG